MLALLPFLSGTLLTLIFYSKQKAWRSSILCAAVILGVFIALSTEILSLLHLVNFVALGSAWLLLNSLLIWIAIKKKAFSQISIRQNIIPWNQLEDLDRLLCVGTGIIILIVGVIAIVAPPNNWDSMSYVMPRVIHWIQNHSVDHYPTHYTPQLHNSPWAEFALMHLQILSGGDSLANVPQWLSMIGCLLGVSLISQHLGADLRGQVFSVLVCATIPVGILHASNSKNTYITAFWLTCFAYYGILLIKKQPNWNLILAIVTSFSLAILTKGTAYTYTLPFIVWLVFSVIVRLRKKTVTYLIGAIAIILVINGGHYFRNFLVFGSPISTYPYKLSNEIYSLPVFISSVIRNASLHLTPPFFDVENIDRFVVKIHQFLGVNPVNPKLNFPGGYHPSEFTTLGVQVFEDIAGNSFHFWLALLAIIILFKSETLRKNKIFIAYLLATISSFLTFCILIKWQIWHSRLHLPVFVLMCPVIGIVLAQALNRKVSQYILIILLVAASPYLLINETRPIAATTNIFNTDRITQYFAARTDLQDDYINVVNLVNQNSCHEIGLIQRPDAWEYPLWVLLTEKSRQSIRVENVNVMNPSNVIAQNSYYRSFQPCMLVSIGLPRVQQITVHNQIYDASEWRNKYVREPMQVFFKR